MLARWSELSFRKTNNDPAEDELRRIIGNEASDQNFIKTDIIHEYGPVTFFLDDVKSYNRSKEKGHTTVKFKDGDTLVLKIPYFEFMEIDIQYSGNQVHDFLPTDYIDPEEILDDNEDEDLEL